MHLKSQILTLNKLIIFGRLFFGFIFGFMAAFDFPDSKPSVKKSIIINHTFEGIVQFVEELGGAIEVKV